MQRMEKQVQDSVERLYQAQKERDEALRRYEQIKKKEQLSITNYMFTNLSSDENSFDVILSNFIKPIKLKVTKVRRKKVLWKIDKLKNNLDKKTYNQVVNKTYMINNMNGLVKYLKECGVDAKKFKEYIDVEEELNEHELDRLYETGKIGKKELKGCYDIEVSEPYIRLMELRG